MKKLNLLIFVFILSVLSSIAQVTKVPALMNMVAVVRDSSTHLPLANTNINVRLIIYTGGVETYCVLRTDVPTNGYGEISLEWGVPTNNSNNFACQGTSLTDAEWQNGSTSYSLYWTTSSTANYFRVDSGSFAAVPYAFASITAEHLVTPGATNGQVLTWNGTAWVPGTVNGNGGTTYTAGNGISISGTGAISATNGVPAGTIMAWAGDISHVPTGWLLCDGKLLSNGQNNYPGLWDAIGTYWGNDGNNGDFNLPDLRGRFLRGQDNGSANDPDASSRTSLHSSGHTGDKVGSYQNDTLKSHNHSISGNIPCGAGFANFSSGNSGSGVYGNGQTSPVIGFNGGNETRPKNAYVNYIIKY